MRTDDLKPSLRGRLRLALLEALDSVAEVEPDLAGREVPQRLIDGLRQQAGLPGCLLLVAGRRGPTGSVEARLWLSAGQVLDHRPGGRIDLASLDPEGCLFGSPGDSLARIDSGLLALPSGPDCAADLAGPVVLVELPLGDETRAVLGLALGTQPAPEELDQDLRSIARPISGMLRAVEVIRRLEARASVHRSIVETGEQLVHSVGPDGRIQFVNGHWLRVLGYEEQALEAMTIFDVIAPASMEHCQGAFQMLFQGQAVIGADIVFLRADGVEVELHGDLFPRLVDGQMVSTQAFLRDVTEERREQRRRASGQALLDAVVDNAPEGICFLRLDGRIQRVNREFTRLFGYSAEEAFEQHIDDLVVPDQGLEEARDICRMAENGELINREVSRRRKDGSELRVSLLSAPVHVGGKQFGVVAIYRDISEQRELEARLARSQRMEALGRLAGGIAHDFNNLLTVIQLSSEYVLDQLPEEAPVRVPVQEIVTAGQSAAALTRRLLEFGRRHVVQPEPVDANQLLQNLLPMARRLLGEDRTLVTELADDSPRILADPGQLEQVVVNLILNARDAMAGGGRLTLVTRAVELDAARAGRADVAPGRYLELSVADTGTGMSPEVLDRIFEPFYSTKSSEGRGSGLGLSTVYGFLEQCRAGIEVESRVGEGSTFRLLLPELAGAREASSQGDGPDLEEVGPARILLLEDESVIREMVRTVLERDGHELVVPVGLEALEELLAGSPSEFDLLLTDVVMPGASGPELAERLRAQQPALRVLYMSGFNDDQLLRRGLERGEAHFVAKPFKAADLSRRVREVLRASTGSPA